MSRTESLLRDWMTERADGFRFALAAFLLALLFAPLAAFDRTAPLRPETSVGAAGPLEVAANDRRGHRGVLPRGPSALGGASGAEPGLPASSSIERRFAKWLSHSGSDGSGKALFVAEAAPAWSLPQSGNFTAISVGGLRPGETRSHHFLTRAPPVLRG